MKIVITGPTGTIGIALIHLCLTKDIEVLAICRRNSSGIALLPAHPLLRIVELDLAEYSKSELTGTYDVFYHFAWSNTMGAGRNDMYAQSDNIRYTLDAVRLAQKLNCHTFVGAGSQAEYGRSDQALNSRTPTFPENGYGAAKLAAGHMSRIQCELLGLKHIWARILSVYGPGDDPRTLISGTLRKMLLNQELTFTKGEQLWDFLYSEDAAEMLYRLALKGKSNQVYCLGSGIAKPLKMFVQEMAGLTNTENGLKFGAVPYSENQVMHLAADISELQNDIGELRLFSFREGIEKTLQDIREKLNREEKETGNERA